MYLSLSKRFDFESSHRLAVVGLSDERNTGVYGREGLSRHGHGHNFSAYLVFEGPVDQATGMMINVTIIKDRIKAVIDGRYDHRFLNDDTPPFDRLVPTPENIARQLLEEAKPLFADAPAKPVVCHLSESPVSEATAYVDGRVERHLWVDFSASRRTHSPHLSNDENEALFGLAASRSGHGHHYRLRVTLAGEIDAVHGMIFPEAEGRRILAEFHGRFDHRNLSLDISDFGQMPMTTEVLARHFFHYLKDRLPVCRVKLHENERFFVEYSENDSMLMGVLTDFHAAHRLHSRQSPASENLAVFGKCNNPRGHGHLYRVECTIGGELDERTGTLYNLAELNGIVIAAADRWNYRHLNLDTDDFADKTTTGENIIQVLWQRLEDALADRLHRLRLWETENNRFALRRRVKGTTSQEGR